MRVRKAFLLVAALSLIASGFGVSPAAATPAAEGCIRPMVRTATPVGTGSCPGVRPGAYIIVPARNAGCTLGFAYGGSDGRYYMTTAGHCVAAQDAAGRPVDGQKVWSEGTGPVVTDGRGKPFGRFVFYSLSDRYDIGIILVTKGIYAKATMCHFGGPTGLSTSRTSSRVVLEHYGNSIGFGDVVPARTGITNGMPDPYVVMSLLPAAPGDSGGPVIAASSGRAIGLVTSLSFGFVIGTGVQHTGVTFITRLGPQMALAQKYLKKTFKLRTAPHSASMF